MNSRWQDMSNEVLEAHFNPRVASADAEGALARYAARSAAARAALASESDAIEDLRYGQGPLGTLDLYRPRDGSTSRPLAVFIHGGYWRALDKSDHSFVVPPLVAAGAVAVNLNYDLCPAVTLDQMSAQAIAGVRYCHERAESWGCDPERLVLIGHSAGAHLAARVLNAPADAGGRPADLVQGLAAISGVYEPEIVLRLPTVNEQARITADDAARNDCLSRPPGGRARLEVWAGGDEPAGWIDQSHRYADLARSAGLDCHEFEIGGADHFTVLERSFETDSPGWHAILRLLATE